MKKIKIFMLLLGLLVLVSCQNNTEETKVETSQKQEVSVEETKEADTSKTEEVAVEEVSEEEKDGVDEYGFLDKANQVVVTEDTVTFVDGDGEEITLEKNPQRVVSLYTSNAALWVKSGGKLVGRIQTKDSDNELPDAAKTEDITIVANSSSGKKISVEKVAEVKPDLVLLGNAMSQPMLKEGFKNLGIKSVVVDYESLGDYLKWIKVFSALNNNEKFFEESGKQTLKESLEVINEVKEISEKPKGLIIFPGDTLKANTSKSNLGAMFEQLGGINLANEWEGADKAPRVEMSMESLLAADPDIIIVQYTTSIGNPVAFMDNLIKENPAWNELTALKEGRYYFTSKEFFQYRPDEKFSQAYKEIAGYMYPDISK